MTRKITDYYLTVISGERKGFAAASLRVLLRLLSFLFAGGVYARDLFYRCGIFPERRLPKPVVSVGNVTWGGTGKTPLVIYLAEKYLSLGMKPLIISRGYGNDEVKALAARLPRAAIITGKNRAAAAEKYFEKQDADIVICDDAFQHRGLARDWDVAVLNARRPYGNGHLIPRGELREPVSSLRRADLLVWTHAENVNLEKMAGNEVYTCHQPLYFYRGNEKRDAAAFSTEAAVMVCAIGEPGQFAEALQRNGVRVAKSFIFPDHYAFTEKDFSEISAWMKREEITQVITTEKDYYRCQELWGRSLRPWLLKVDLRVLRGEEIIENKLKQICGNVPRAAEALFLSDGKAGHETALQALREWTREAASGAERENFLLKKVIFKSVWHARILGVSTALLTVFGLGGKAWLRFFLAEECLHELEAVRPRIIFSAGNTVLPVNILLSCYWGCKRAVFMKPSALFSSARFDWVIAPRHDFPVRGKRVSYTEIIPNQITPDFLRQAARELREKTALPESSAVSFFIGGNTRAFVLEEEKIAQALRGLLRLCREAGKKLLLTTSRRTPEPIAAAVKEICKQDDTAALYVIANENNIPGVIYGMLGLSDAVFVTEDSLAMLSEAVSSGKRVTVLRAGNGKLPKKHSALQNNLRERGWIGAVKSSEISARDLLGRDAGAENILRAAKDEIIQVYQKLMACGQPASGSEALTAAVKD